MCVHAYDVAVTMKCDVGFEFMYEKDTSITPRCLPVRSIQQYMLQWNTTVYI